MDEQVAPFGLMLQFDATYTLGLDQLHCWSNEIGHPRRHSRLPRAGLESILLRAVETGLVRWPMWNGKSRTCSEPARAPAADQPSPQPKTACLVKPFQNGHVGVCGCLTVG